MSITCVDYLVIGAGPAGMAAAHTLRCAGKRVVIFEQNAEYGGLCGNFNVAGCNFDKFVHLSFAPDELRNTMFNSSSLIEHKPDATNFYKNKWIKHPAITNLAPLPICQKAKVAASFLKRDTLETPANYYEWTKQTYGKYFADEFIEKYTRKYWGLPGSRLDTSWVGPRFQKPTFNEIYKGMFTKNEKSTFYIPMMYYPDRSSNGRSGYVQILDKAANGLYIIYNHKCTGIDPISKECTFNNTTTIAYNHLISTMPMPEMLMALSTINNADKLKIINDFKHTCGYMVSLVFNEPNITDKLWFYVYDTDIAAARFYSPSLCCPSSVSVPGKMSTVQGEIYFSEQGLSEVKPISVQYYVDNTIDNLKRLGIDRNKLIAIDIRREKYANIIFDEKTHIAKNTMQKLLDSYKIVNCGRFGKWEYLWSHQAWSSGVEAAKQAIAIR